MLLQLSDAMQTVDRFEALIAAKGISIPANGVSGDDMLPLWLILKRIREGFTGNPDDLRDEYTAGVAVHDLAAKVVAVGNHPDFDLLVPHLKMLASGAVHLTKEPPYGSADVYNKLIELYWACLLMGNGLRINLDHPKHSLGTNPDVIALGPATNRAYAFKTIRSPHTQSLLDHLKKGIDQIERSEASEGIVAFQLTPRIAKADLWPENSYYVDWRIPAAKAVELFTQMVSQVVIDNGQAEIDRIFAGKKAVGAVLCLGVFPTVARNPLTGNPVVMPVKVATVVEVAPNHPISDSLHAEIEAANDKMQTEL
ncbi:hypothetical protein BJF93_20485 [Xaviernesmea oryzae]|uniref:Uncharacterized protein n=1 Tax=Xaviernesmea oryzae TaxID=464029 RepID=A0A1Q9AVW5_9HYPH|nr:hypothetical protein [Xaviernesmea oryzae]OLP59592.1 hypothetical protein BJF93_20485 [Xaviernesmea oryzae]SEM12679.1 hypothetical protein SAMN04487976_12014 [Xaviernesmea oryzae]